MSNLIIEWSGAEFTALKRKPLAPELGSPLSSHGGLMHHIRDAVPNRQGVVVGCKVTDLTNPYWTWLTLSEALVSVFGFQSMPALIEVLKTDQSGLLDELYEKHHGFSFV